MEEHTLVNRYLEYKAGTAKLVNWLANTARSSQDITGIVPSLRGAKAAAKLAKQKSYGHTIPNTSVAITTSQLLSLAKIVVKAKVTVPEGILRTTRGVIAGRQHCAEWHASLSTSTNALVAEQNRKHQHFIEVLRQIQGLLTSARDSKPLAKSTKSKTAAQSSEPNNPSAEDESFVNMFTGLQVEEPSSNPLGFSTAPKKTLNKVTFELEDSRESKTFAIWCLLQDMRDVRYQVRTLWRKYKAGNVSLNVAGSVTEYAVGMLRYAENEFVTEHQGLRFYGNIKEHLGLTTYQHGMEIFMAPGYGNDKGRTRNQTLSNADLAHLFCPKASCLLTAFQNAVEARLQLDAMPSEATLGESFIVHPFGWLLQSLLPDFEALSRVSQVERSSLFETLTSLQLLADELQNPPMTSQVIALQIAMDINEVVGPGSKSEMNQFIARLATDQRSLTKCLKSMLQSPNLEMPGGVTVHHATRTLQQHKELFEDPYHKAHRFSSENKNMTVDPKHPPFRVYRGFPSIPGQIIHTSAMGAQAAGLELCNHECLVLSVAYLYKGAQRAGAIVQSWPDMEFIIAVQNAHHSFVLEPDSGMASLLQCFGRSLGMSPNAFLRGQRPRLPKIDSILKRANKLESPCPVLGVVQNALKNKDEHSLELGLSVYGIAASRCLERVKKFANKPERLDHILIQHTKAGKITPAQFLSCVEAVFMENDMNLNFDYVQFGASCIKLIQMIYDSCVMNLSSTSGKRSSPYEIAYAILRDAADRSGNTEEQKHSILHRVAPLIESHINQEGDTYLSAARGDTIVASSPSKTGSTDTPEICTVMSDDDIMSIQSFLGLPTYHSDHVGHFCNSMIEAEHRAEVLKAYTLAMNDLKSPGFQALGKTIIQMMDTNLQQMTDEEKEQMKVKLGKSMRETSNEALADLKATLLLIGLTLQAVLDYVSTRISS